MLRNILLRSAAGLFVATTVVAGCCGSGLFQDSALCPTPLVENVLRDAINALNQNSADWQGILERAQAKLTEDAQSLIRNELQALIDRSVAHAGVEFRCNVDFVGARVKEEVERILAVVLGQTPAPRKAVFCQVVPESIARELVPDRVPYVGFYGYNFDAAADLKVYLEDVGGGSAEIPSSKIDAPTHYVRTVKFGPTGVQLTDRSNRIVLRFGGETHTVGITQPTCKTKIEAVRNKQITYMPPSAGGDREFDGNGPFVYAQTRLVVSRTKVEAQTYMRAIETTSDWTSGEGTRTELLYAAPSGWRIDKVDAPKSEQRWYTDGNHVEDTFTGSSLVQSWKFVGDTAGDDVEVQTRVQITFNPINVTLTQTEGCQSPGAPPPLSTGLSTCSWLGVFSEEQGDSGRKCASGSAVRGVECTGRYCDNIGLLCCPYSTSGDPTAAGSWSSWISEESPHNELSSNSQVLAGARCSGRYCDDVSGWMVSGGRVGSISSASCRWTGWFSEEGRGYAICEPNELVTGLGCKGSYCDDLRVRCCAVPNSDPR